MSATGLVVCHGTALLEIRTEVSTLLHEDWARFFVLFWKIRTEECLMWRTSSTWTSHLFVHTAAKQTRDGRGNYSFRSSCYSSGHFPLRLRLPVWSSVSPADSSIYNPISITPLSFLMWHGKARRRRGRGREGERESETLLLLWTCPKICSKPQ